MELRKASVVSIENLTHNTPYAMFLSYPKSQGIELKKRLRELRTLGVKALEFSGDKRISNVNVLGKGCVGIVLVAYVDKKKAALKVRRLDADRAGMQREAAMLKKANSVGVGPELLGVTNNLLLMQFVEGLLLPDWIRKHAGKVRIKRVLRRILKQCWLLDGIGLDHGELSHAPKHIIIDRTDRPFIVDFETASVNRTPANVTSICQFLFISGIAMEVAERIGRREKGAVVEALRAYKRRRDRMSLDKVLEACAV
jgi:putative serine/threonine protein kinase